jgi:hypothetical protein
MDGVSSEPYVYVDDPICVLFALLFISMIVHGYPNKHGGLLDYTVA